jgi:signal peptidase I
VVVTAAFVTITVQYGWEFDAVLSGSMEPKISVGGLVVIKPVDAMTLRIGDVISYQRPDLKTPICHRIVEVQEKADGRYFVTKGDANEEIDESLVPVSAVNGKEVYYLPHVGKLTNLSNFGRERVRFLGKSVPKALLIVVPLGLLFIGILFKETLEDTFHPFRKRRREYLKKRRRRATRQ